MGTHGSQPCCQRTHMLASLVFLSSLDSSGDQRALARDLADRVHPSPGHVLVLKSNHPADDGSATALKLRASHARLFPPSHPRHRRSCKCRSPLARLRRLAHSSAVFARSLPSPVRRLRPFAVFARSPSSPVRRLRPFAVSTSSPARPPVRLPVRQTSHCLARPSAPVTR
jgi:hypothetical protein